MEHHFTLKKSKGDMFNSSWIYFHHFLIKAQRLKYQLSKKELNYYNEDYYVNFTYSLCSE